MKEKQILKLLRSVGDAEGLAVLYADSGGIRAYPSNAGLLRERLRLHDAQTDHALLFLQSLLPEACREPVAIGRLRAGMKLPNGLSVQVSDDFEVRVYRGNDLLAAMPVVKPVGIVERVAYETVVTSLMDSLRIF